MKKYILLFAIIPFASGCWIPFASNSPSPSDSISYVIIGTSVVGSVLIDYNTPTDGVISQSVNLTNIFDTGTIAGYSQFINTKPSITITIISTGCVEAQIRKNADIVKDTSKCGPISFSVTY